MHFYMHATYDKRTVHNTMYVERQGLCTLVHATYDKRTVHNTMYVERQGLCTLVHATYDKRTVHNTMYVERQGLVPSSIFHFISRRYKNRHQIFIQRCCPTACAYTLYPYINICK